MLTNQESQEDKTTSIQGKRYHNTSSSTSKELHKMFMLSQDTTTIIDLKNKIAIEVITVSWNDNNYLKKSQAL